MKTNFPIPERIADEPALEEFLAQPYPELVEMMRRLDGNIMVLGAGGKMGPSLARLAQRACADAEVTKTIYAVSRFSDERARQLMEDSGIRAISADLADPEQVNALPRVKNVIFMAGQKFGTIGDEPQLWIMNTVVPGNVARAFRDSRIVVFSTGCVYELRKGHNGGSRETDAVAPVGEYANSCVGRERVFQFYSQKYGTPVLLYRLNYAIDLRYGVLVDVAERISGGEPVNITVNAANVIWQGDANNRALLALEHAASPAVALNVTGPECVNIQDAARSLGKALGREVQFDGTDQGHCFLSDATLSNAMFGPPRVSVEQMMRWIVHWIQNGQRLLSKPTHFSVTDGQFLDAKV